MHAALMAGGQLTKRMLTKHVKLEPGKGTATFDYQASHAFLASNEMKMPRVWQQGCSNCQHTQFQLFQAVCRNLCSP